MDKSYLPSRLPLCLLVSEGGREFACQMPLSWGFEQTGCCQSVPRLRQDDLVLSAKTKPCACKRSSAVDQTARFWRIIRPIECHPALGTILAVPSTRPSFLPLRECGD